MKKLKSLIIALASVIMACVMALTGCNGTVTAIKDCIQNTGNSSVVEETDSTQSVDVKETEGDDSNCKNFEGESSIGEFSLNDGGISREDVYSFAVYETAYKLDKMGYDVYRGAAITSDEKETFGLIYTNYNLDSDGNLTGGFIELLEEDARGVLTDEIVEKGIVAVADSESQTDGFVIDRYVSLRDSSGVFGDYYFTNVQTSNYAVSISVSESEQSTLDKSIDCVDYNEGETLWLGDVAPTISFDACSLYTADEEMAYNTALEAVKDICALQDSNAYNGTYYSLVVIETAVLEAIALGEQTGVIGTEEGGYYDLSEIGQIELEENQILMVTATDGVKVLTLPTEAELKAAADSRAAMGLIQIIGGVLLAVGSVAICVVTCGTAAPAVTAVCIATGTIATTYAVSNIIEGVSDVYYGLNGDVESQSVNPVKDLIIKATGSEETGNIVYHAVGIGASLLQSLIIPVNAGLTVANRVNAGVGRTILIVGRAVAVETVKMAVTAGVSYLASLGISNLTTELTGSEALGQLAGFAGALIAGAATYRGLTAIDHRFNFSGIYSKTGLSKGFSDVTLRERALKQFNEAEWNKMSISEKKSAIEQLAKVISNELGLENPPNIKYYYEKGSTYGYFYDEDNALYINTYFFSNGDTPWVEIVDTVAHETRHAYQHELVLSGVQNDITDSYTNYISYDESPTLYYNQPCEADAYSYGTYWANLLRTVSGS